MFGLSVITGLTAQNTRRVHGVELPTTDFIAAQLRAVLEDIGADAVTTGMLATGDIIRTVAGAVRDFRLANLVVDPVMIAASGDALMRHEAAPVMRERLFPLATVVTPNLDEATVLCERKIRTLEEMQEAARTIHAMGPRYVLIKGGHLPGDRVVDVLFDGREFIRREGARISGEFPARAARCPPPSPPAWPGASRCATPWRQPRPTSRSPSRRPRSSDTGGVP